MQFIRNGPHIPDTLLEAHEDGKIVFFCGAGVSYPAGLPGFNGLVRALYQQLGAVPTPVQAAAIRAGQFDTAIGLLEADIAGGRERVRLALVDALKPTVTTPKAIATHEALLTLATNREGRCRLITTNFDRLFEMVIREKKLPTRTFQAPLLPVPKTRLDGLVYLHGLISEAPTASELHHLVLSSGDFGLAYLTERWASRFVSEVFRNYTVCFVGYSINDPVLRYMTDALAADRLLGESSPEMFAFGSYSAGQHDHRANEWRAKNVTPILYPEHNRHSHLHRSLQTWATTFRDGTRGKERIVSEYALARPLSSTNQDDYVGRMLWALSDKGALPAKRFADLEPRPSLEWLEPLGEPRFKHSDLSRFGVSPNRKANSKLEFSAVRRPTPYELAPQMTLVTNGWVGTGWDDVMNHLARWLARHIDDEKLAVWVAKRGGRVHEHFARHLRNALETQAVRKPMRTLWHLLLSGRHNAAGEQLSLFEWRTRFRSEGMSAAVRMSLRDLLTPKIHIRELFRWIDETEVGHREEPTKIKEIVDCELVLVSSHTHSVYRDLSTDQRWLQSLPDLLLDATGLLRDCMDLFREIGAATDTSDNSYSDRPSIAEHAQNRNYRDWTSLIDLVRDSWLATVPLRPESARLEAQRWWTIPYPVFKRLAFFAATHGNLISASEGLDWLLSDNGRWFWSREAKRESFRLLVALAPQLDAEQLERLECSILAGPPRHLYVADLPDDNFHRTVDREVWVRLAKMRQAVVAMSDEATRKLADLSAEHPRWQLADDQRDEFPVWIGVGAGEDWYQFIPTPERTPELVAWLGEHPAPEEFRHDGWLDKCKRDFRRPAAALRHLASLGEWFPARMGEALQAWSDDERASISWTQFGRLLAEAPQHVIEGMTGAIAWWLQNVAQFIEGEEAAFFILIERVMTAHREDAITDDEHPVSAAINHPVGLVTEAAFRWWYRQRPDDGEGLHERIAASLTPLCDVGATGYRHGRIVLAKNVIGLFRVDPVWTTAHVLSLFDWTINQGEARAAWEGFLWTPRIHPPLLEALRGPFIATAVHYAELGEHADQYSAFLTFIALEPNEVFSRPELAAAMRALPSEGLANVAVTLARALEGSGTQRSEYWQNRVLPFIRNIWPRSRNAVTPSVADGLARLCIVADQAFPTAFQELKHAMEALDHPDYVVHLLDEANLSARFPEPVLDFLSLLVADDLNWPPRDLSGCLQALVEAAPILENDARYVRLFEFLRRHGAA